MWLSSSDICLWSSVLTIPMVSKSKGIYKCIVQNKADMIMKWLREGISNFERSGDDKHYPVIKVFDFIWQTSQSFL